MNDDKHPAESVAPCDHFPVEFAAQGERDAFHAALHTTLGEAVRAQEVMRLADAWVDAECRARGLRTTEDMMLRSWVAYMRDSRDKAEADAAAYRDLVRLRRVEEYRAEDGVVLWWSGGVPVEISDWDGSPDWTDAWSPVPKVEPGAVLG